MIRAFRALSLFVALTLAAPVAAQQVADQVPWRLQVGRGEIPGWTAGVISGNNTSIGTTEETIWPGAALGGSGYEDPAFPTALVAMSVSSEGSNDASAGTGARTVGITGLDAAGDPIAEQTITMNGQTEVAIPTSLARVTGFRVITAGSSGENEAGLWIGSGVFLSGGPLAATAFYEMAPATNFGHNGFYTIQNGKRLQPCQTLLSVDGTKVFSFRLYTRSNGVDFTTPGLWVQRRDVAIQAGGSPAIIPQSSAAVAAIAGMTDLRLVGFVDTATADAHGRVDILLGPD